jgi:hypothetical protein
MEDIRDPDNECVYHCTSTSSLVPFPPLGKIMLCSTSSTYMHTPLVSNVTFRKQRHRHPMRHVPLSRVGAVPRQIRLEDVHLTDSRPFECSHPPPERQLRSRHAGGCAAASVPAPVIFVVVTRCAVRRTSAVSVAPCIISACRYTWVRTPS